MNDSPKPKITLSDASKMKARDLIKLDIKTLRGLENEATKTVFSASITLKWIRGAIAKKNGEQTGNGKTDA